MICLHTVKSFQVLLVLIILEPSQLGLQNTPTASLQRGRPLNQCPRYDTKQANGKVQVMLQLWRMQSTYSLPLLPGPLWLGVVEPDWVLSLVRPFPPLNPHFHRPSGRRQRQILGPIFWLNRTVWLWMGTKQSDGEVPQMVELWGIRSTPSLPLLPAPLWPGMVAPDRALSLG